VVLYVTTSLALSPRNRFQELASSSSAARSEKAIGSSAAAFLRTAGVRFSLLSSGLSWKSTQEAGASGLQLVPRP
jgi:hypothetical protein